MGRGLSKKLVLSLGLIAFIFTILSLIVIAGCSNTLMDDVLEKIHEDKIADGTAPTYTVTYLGNENTGGDVPVDLTKYLEGDTVTVLGAGSLVRGGYSFVNWNTDPNGLGDTYTPAPTLIMGISDVKLYAQWTPNPVYTVTYNDNNSTDGSVPIDIINYEEGQTVIVLGNMGNLMRTGYYFTGWNTEPNGNGTPYTEGQTFSMDGENEILYAKWVENPAYTVTYNSNGSTDGSVPIDIINYEEGQTVTILGNTGILVKINVTGTSYRFNGWNTQDDGQGMTYIEGQTFLMAGENEILYAEWIAYGLRDTGPAGGLIFYDQGYYAFGWRYMEAAPSDNSFAAEWCDSAVEITGADGTNIGTGVQNTIDIEAGCSTSGTAADICTNLILGSYNDWFLPCKDELNLMNTELNLYSVGDFGDSALYWSSSEVSASNAWILTFNSDGYWNPYPKWGTRRVRAARVF